MFKKILIVALTFFNVIAVYYLISPTPTLPELENSVRSMEPGDTVQLKNVSAYYTNLSRTEVINFYKARYSGMFRMIINHPPERAKEIIRDTTQSYYLEEFVLPFKESIYINGFEWENDVFTKPDKRIKNKLIYQDKVYKAKITIKSFPTTIAQRLITLFAIEIGIFIILRMYISLLKKHRD